MKKTGISELVGIVLLILIVVAGVMVLWLWIIPYLDETEVDNSGSSISINFVEGYTCYDVDSDISIVQVERGESEFELPGFKVIFIEEGMSHLYYASEVEVNSRKVFWFYHEGHADKVEIVPYFTRKDKLVEGGVVSYGPLKECDIEEEEIPVPEVRVEDCGDGTVQGDEDCDNGFDNTNEPVDYFSDLESCRINCKRPRCGDGILDQTYEEIPNVWRPEVCDYSYNSSCLHYDFENGEFIEGVCSENCYCEVSFD